jgi:hypothetical protein
MPTSIETIKNTLNGTRLSISQLPFGDYYRGHLPSRDREVLVDDHIIEL